MALGFALNARQKHTINVDTIRAVVEAMGVGKSPRCCAQSIVLETSKRTCRGRWRRAGATSSYRRRFSYSFSSRHLAGQQDHGWHWRKVGCSAAQNNKPAAEGVARIRRRLHRCAISIAEICNKARGPTLNALDAVAHVSQIACFVLGKCFACRQYKQWLPGSTLV